MRLATASLFIADRLYTVRGHNGFLTDFPMASFPFTWRHPADTIEGNLVKYRKDPHDIGSEKCKKVPIAQWIERLLIYAPPQHRPPKPVAHY